MILWTRLSLAFISLLSVLLLASAEALEEACSADNAGEECLDKTPDIARAVAVDTFYVERGVISSVTNCNKDDGTEKYQKCLAGSVDAGKDIIESFLNDEMPWDSTENAMKFFKNALTLVGHLHPALSSGLEIVNLFIGDDSANSKPPWVDDIMKKFEELGGKINEVKFQLNQVESNLSAAICLQDLQDDFTAIGRSENHFKNIMKLSSTVNSNWSVQKQQNQYLNAVEQFNDSCKELDKNVQSIQDVLGVGQNSLVDCAAKLKKSIGPRSKLFVRDAVAPTLNMMLKGIELIGACPRQPETARTNANEQFKRVEKMYSAVLQEIEDSWWKDDSALKTSFEGKKAPDIYDILERDWTFDYYFSVVEFSANERRDAAFAYHNDKRDKKEGMIVAVQPNGSEDKGQVILIFYRRKDLSSYGSSRFDWKNKSNGKKCMSTMCLKPHSVYNEVGHTCVPDYCHDSWSLFKSLPKIRNNQSLDNALRNSPGVVFVKRATLKLTDKCIVKECVPHNSGGLYGVVGFREASQTPDEPVVDEKGIWDTITEAFDVVTGAVVTGAEFVGGVAVDLGNAFVDNAIGNCSTQCVEYEAKTVNLIALSKKESPHYKLAFQSQWEGEHPDVSKVHQYRYDLIYPVLGRNGKDGHWTKIEGGLKQVSVSANGDHVWGVTNKDEIYYRNGKDGHWTKIEGGLKQVSVSANGDHVWGVNNKSEVHYRNGKDGQWTMLIGGALNQVSVSANGEHVWGVIHDKVYYRNGKDGQWTEIEGGLNQVSVSANGEHVWGVIHDKVYYRNGKDGQWTEIGGALDQVSVSANGEHVWGVLHDRVYYRNGKDGQWTHIEGSLKQVSVSGNGEYVWGVNNKDEILYRPA